MRKMAFVLLFMLIAEAVSGVTGVGDIPFDAVGETHSGEEIKISSYKDKVVIVSFWATWCGACMKELPVLSAIQKKAGTDELQVIAVNYRESRRQFGKIADALADNPMVITSDARGGIGKKFGVKGIPHMLIIDRQGKVADVHVGYGEDSLPNLVEEINEIGQSASPASVEEEAK